MGSEFDPPLYYIIFQGNYASKKEAIMAVHNLTSFGSVDQILSLLRLGVLQRMFNYLLALDDEVCNVRF